MSQMENKYQTKRLNPKYIILNVNGLKSRVWQTMSIGQIWPATYYCTTQWDRVFLICLFVFYILKGYKEMHQ